MWLAFIKDANRLHSSNIPFLKVLGYQYSSQSKFERPVSIEALDIACYPKIIWWHANPFTTPCYYCYSWGAEFPFLVRIVPSAYRQEYILLKYGTYTKVPDMLRLIYSAKIREDNYLSLQTDGFLLLWNKLARYISPTGVTSRIHAPIYACCGLIMRYFQFIQHPPSPSPLVSPAWTYLFSR